MAFTVKSEDKISLGEVFSIAGGAATGIAGALTPGGSSTAATASVVPAMDFTYPLIGGAAGAGLGYVAGFSPLLGGLGGLLAGYLVSSGALNPIGLAPGGV